MPAPRLATDRRLQQHYASADDNDDLLRPHPSRLRARSFGGRWGNQLQVAKLVEYDVLVPSDAGASVTKLIEYDVLAPPNDRASVAKLVEYVIVERQPAPATARPIVLRYRLLWPEEVDEPIGLTPWGRRFAAPNAYESAAVMPAVAAMRRLLMEPFRCGNADESTLSRVRRTYATPPRLDAFVPIVIVN